MIIIRMIQCLMNILQGITKKEYTLTGPKKILKNYKIFKLSAGN